MGSCEEQSCEEQSCEEQSCEVQSRRLSHLAPRQNKLVCGDAWRALCPSHSLA